jgi:hypothetical protein
MLAASGLQSLLDCWMSETVYISSDGGFGGYINVRVYVTLFFSQKILAKRGFSTRWSHSPNPALDGGPLSL